MFPVNSIPLPSNTQWQVFYASGTGVTASTNSFQIWQKPAGCSMVYIFALGGGGGGGRPANGAITVGGGGGGSSGVARILIPAVLLPDTLYARAGIGGAGATSANSAGADGLSTYVAVYPTADASATVRTSNYILSVGGGGGGAASTTGGAAGGAALATGSTFSSLGLWYSIAGVAGTAGASAANTNATSVTNSFYAGGVITYGGSGGGNGTGSGGNFSTTTLTQYLPLIAGGTGTTGGAGNAGLNRGLPISVGLKNTPLFFTGGTGGGGHSTGTAGRGGDASYGGGGGGGGGCSGAGTSGNGGNGGDGFVIIGTF